MSIGGVAYIASALCSAGDVVREPRGQEFEGNCGALAIMYIMYRYVVYVCRLNDTLPRLDGLLRYTRA